MSGIRIRGTRPVAESLLSGTIFSLASLAKLLKNEQRTAVLLSQYGRKNEITLAEWLPVGYNLAII